MPANLRQTEILSRARRDGSVSVEILSQELATSVQTIRRDLSELSEKGYLKRTHGGAILRSGMVNLDYAERDQLNSEAKRAIAKRCATDIPENSAVFLNIGTTTEAVARELLDHRNLLVVTNNLKIANILSANPGCELMVAGGLLRRSDGGLIGDMTTKMIQQFKFDVAVIGCSALDHSGDILDFDLQEVNVSQTILAQSRQSFLVADNSKFTRSAPVRIASLAEISAFYTDAPLDRSLVATCAGWKTQVKLP